MDNIPKSVQEVYNVFIEYFKEPNVDLQKEGSLYSIIVFWDTVTISNEYNDHINIWKLFAKVLIDSRGTLSIGPKFIRSEYNKIQWEGNYCHSHIASIPYSNISSWSASCLGNGPIRNTIKFLFYDNDLLRWKLFCWELDKYVRIESIFGGPYHRMRNVGMDSMGDNKIQLISYYSRDNLVSTDLLLDFIKYIINKDILKIGFKCGNYIFDMSNLEFSMAISNCFIEYYNSNLLLQKAISSEKLENRGFISKYCIVNDSLIDVNTRRYRNVSVPLSNVLGNRVLKFKGKSILMTENKNTDSTNTEYIILARDVLGYIAFLILKLINIYYGKEQTLDSINQTTRII